MTELDLDNAMARLRQKKLPDCPANLEQNVWRKTRIRRENSQNDLVNWLHRNLFEIGGAIPALALAVLLSSTVSSIALSQKLARSQAASVALDFDLISQAESLSPFAQFGKKH